MGYPKITYGASSDLIVDFTDYLREGSGYRPQERISTKQAISGIEDELHYHSQGFVDLRFRHITPDVKSQLEQFREYAKDGSTFTVELDRDLGGFWGFENKSLKNNDQVDGTFTRGGFANDSAFQRRDGIYVLNDLDLPRMPVAGKFGDGIIIENMTVNDIGADHSDFSAWTATDITVSTNTTETKDPFGNNNADKLTATAANGDVTYTTSRAVGNVAVFSVFLKSPSGTVSTYLELLGTTGGFTLGPELSVPSNGSDGNGFTRYQFAIDTSTFTGDIQARIIISDNTDILYAIAAQVEDNKAYAGSFNSSGEAENLTYPSTNLISKERGTIGFWIKPFWIYNAHGSAILFMCADDSTAATRHSHIEVNSGGNLRFLLRSNNDGTFAVDLNATASSLSQNEWNHVVATWDATISNGVKLYINGVQVGVTSTNDPFNISDIGSLIGIGCITGANGFEADAVFDELFILKTVLNATQIKNLYNSPGLAWQRNRITCRLVDKNFPINPLNGGIFDAFIPCKEVLT